jgi:putative isomerase
MKQLAACGFDTRICMQKHFAVVDLSFNCVYADGLKAMAQIAQQLGDNSASSAYSVRRARVLEAMRSELSADGTHFVSRDLIGRRSLPATEWTRFMPLFAGMVSRNEAEKLAAELFDEDLYLSPYGIRTLSKADPAYAPRDGFWRGPIWHAPHFFLYRGLLRYGLTDEAHALKNYTKHLLDSSGFCEYYDSETGSGLGATNFTWGGLYLSMD